MKLAFDAATHTYTLDGIVVPSVTKALQCVMPDYGRADPTLGTLVHEGTAALDAHRDAIYQCGTDAIWEDVHHRIRLWLGWKDDVEFYPVHIEEPVHHSLMRYAGTVDRIGTWKGGEPVILDIKTGDPSPWHGLQLAGYTMAAERMGMVQRDIRRVGVYLQANGYRHIEYDNPTDFSAFTHALELTKWRMQHGG